MLDVFELASLGGALVFCLSALIGLYSLWKIPNQDDRFAYAGFWRRAIAAIVDGIAVAGLALGPSALVGFGLGLAFGNRVSTADLTLMGQATGGFVGLIVAWLYFALMEASVHQATFGKKFLGLQVVDADGGRIGFWRATARHFGKFLSLLTLYIGVFMIGWTRRKQGLHDKVARCVVVRAKATAAIAQARPNVGMSMDRAGLDRALSKPPTAPAQATARKSTMSDRILARIEAGQSGSR